MPRRQDFIPFLTCQSRTELLFTLACCVSFGLPAQAKLILVGEQAFITPSATSPTAASVDFYLKLDGANEPISGYGGQFRFTPVSPNVRFTGAADVNGFRPALSPGHAPSVTGPIGSSIQIVDFRDDVVRDGVGFARLLFTIPAGFQGQLDVIPDPAFTTLSDPSGEPIPFESMLPASIVIGNFLRGDVDLDGDVDLFDFQQLKDGIDGGGDRFDGDLNNDGRVGLADFNLLSNTFGLTGGQRWPPDIIAPEPGAIVLLTFAAGACFVSRSRRRRM